MNFLDCFSKGFISVASGTLETAYQAAEVLIALAMSFSPQGGERCFSQSGSRTSLPRLFPRFGA
ncbi:hypothetical protein VSR17_30330, partial [Cupriavidus taiwanensis]|uniref:hypothetical protein n=1 Tax=Cupriavidus taiwanensis TaxID=164546 RepID=UPI00317EDCCF